MKQRVSLALGLAAVLVSSAAMAANTVKTMTPTQISAQCSSLQTQWDKAAADHAGAAKLTAAKTIAAKGEKACKAGKASGVEDLTQALNDLGVKPKM